jgi:hypothetical protein
MENFFNYITKPVPQEEVDIWFRVNHIIPEKMELFYDFSESLNQLIFETYLGEQNNGNETRISLSNDDNVNHFEWCFNKIIENFLKEGISFRKKGDHYDYFKNFFLDVFYNQKEQNIKNSVKKFFKELFNLDTPFSKSDLDIILLIYKNLDKNMSN